MSNVSGIIKYIQDIMRKDAGTYGDHDFVRERYVVNHGDDEPAYRFELAIGARHPAAEPLPHGEAEFEQKVKLELKRAPTSGGCG